MAPLYLIIAFLLFFLVTFVKIYKIDIIFGFFYMFLFVYTFFSQIGYVYFPELSELLEAYFGPELFYDYYFFVFLSFATYYFIVTRCCHKFLSAKEFKVSYSPSGYQVHIFYMVIIIFLMSMLTYFALNYEQIDYISMSEQEHFAFSFGLKNLTIINVILYCVVRMKNNLHPLINYKYAIFMLFVGIALSIMISVKSGNRTDPFAIMLGIIVFELSYKQTKASGKRILTLLTLIVLVIFGLTRIEALRLGENAPSEITLAEKILFKDYYAPSHILFTAMNFKMVDPLNVLFSNVCNSLVKMDYPYLQTEVANTINPGSSSRSTGYAFYIFSEGYMAMGYIGFIYNGIIAFLGLSLWRYLSSSNNQYFNIFINSLIATQLANMARSQSAYFIKDIYFVFIPAMILFYFATGLKPQVVRLLRPQINVSVENS